MKCRRCQTEITEQTELTEQPDWRRHANCDHYRDCQTCADDCLGQEREPEYDRTPPGWDAFCREFNAGRFS